uniref:Serine/threonine-protein phosphatase 2A 55 kDa regulatory subunit B n=1 Tax=Eutreptiella gymnastica TaxID=73025 RepID=A0A7S1IRE3_9EUGL|mmetsp:Transcript_37769/g.67455  ORF Transcript_37769/g.67455 Transcript_37769/m.67455 type:complete len:456 (+) Transcript_37769:110-1477(+)
MDWKFDCFYGQPGPNEGLEPSEGDLISAVEYDPTGQFIALGDTGGRITILERIRVGQKKEATEVRLHVRFQSHLPEFDYLKSVEIEEKINPMVWLKRINQHNMILAANDKTIKMWKIRSQPSGSGVGFRRSGGPCATQSPMQVGQHDMGFQCHSLKRTYGSVHAYHINSMSLSCDSESFLSADDLRINMWHWDRDESLNVVDIKPANMEDLTEVITSACFHPEQCSTFMYSTSKGTIKVGDLREAAVVQQCSKAFEVEEDPANKTFFSEIISSISDAKFSKDGRYILARDYVTLKIWDVNMERQPVKVLNLHDSLRSRLCDLYENDCIFDKFECTWSGDSRYCFTGSYRNHFKVTDVSSITTSGSTQPKGTKTISIPRPIPPTTYTFEASKPKIKKSNLGGLRKFGAKGVVNKADESYDKCTQADFNKKVLHLAAHPFENEMAVAAQNVLYIFSC